MSSPLLLTYGDLVQRGIRFLRHRGKSPDTKDAALWHADVCACIQHAYRELATRRVWSYFWKPGRINLSAAYSTGTVVYDHTGGTYERQLTLTTGTWPTWTVYGTVRIGSVNYIVEDRKSDSVVTLDAQVNPGADVSSSSYSIFRSSYTLPADFSAGSPAIMESDWVGLQYVRPDDWHRMERADYTSGEPTHYTITRDPSLIGSLAILLYPAPSTAESLDFMYQALPRTLKHSGYDTNDCRGFVSVTSGSATVTGEETSFTSDMVGCVLRISETTADIPSAMDAHEPPAEERVILTYTSATSLTLDAAVSRTLSKVRYSISDPVDYEQSMLDALQRSIEKQLIATFGLDGYDAARKRCDHAYILAAERDSRLLETVQAGMPTGYSSITGHPFTVEANP